MTRRRIETDIAVVGAGPAGLAAATAARESGARVLVVDAFSAAGGQYFMQPLGNGQHRSVQSLRGQRTSQGSCACATVVPLGALLFRKQ